MTFSLGSTELIYIVAGMLAGFIVSALVLGLFYKQRRALLENEKTNLINQKQQLEALLAERSQQLQSQQGELQNLRDSNSQINAENASLNVRLEADRLRFQEQLALLQETKQNLTKEFENLANRIFEEKKEQFNSSSKLSLESTISPLRQEITAFRKKVEDAYDKENAERNKLAGQVIELQKQAQRVSEDAVHLAKALKGDNKMQGNWGEMVLERVLEDSGLTKGREYETQVSLQSTEGQRRNPDVIVHLPQGRDIVIDAKVSLTDYERYCSADSDADKQQFLKQHINSIRAHVTGLNRKAYEQLEGVNSLDFVLIFVPIESAFMLALEHDSTLFRDAYDKGIILVSPTTLLATLRTVHNIWRYEAQSKNAEQIADKAGKLYDQLVLVVESLDDLGKHLTKSQSAWGEARNRLVAGRGNLIKRVEDIRKMGAKTRKNLPANLVTEALENNDDLLDEE